MTLEDRQNHFLSVILDDSKKDLSKGEAVYHHAYHSRLLEALCDTYERVWSWLGDDAFEHAARCHISAHPATSWSLDHFGSEFEQTVAALYLEDSEVRELAWLDWNLRCAFSAENSPAFDTEELAKADWSTACLKMTPSFSHRPLRTNVAAIWQSLSQGVPPPEVMALPVGAGLIVWRDGLQPVFRSLDADEYLAVLSLKDGKSFANICADLESRHPQSETTSTASQWLSTWISSGLVCGIY